MKRESKYLHTFTIDRARWRTGTSGDGESKLLNHEGYQCCIGFLAESCGVEREDMRGIGEIAKLDEHDMALIQSRCPSLVHSGDPSLVEDEIFDNASYFYEINDREALSNAKRESKLAGMFAAERIRVRFVGEYDRAAKEHSE